MRFKLTEMQNTALSKLYLKQQKKNYLLFILIMKISSLIHDNVRNFHFIFDSQYQLDFCTFHSFRCLFNNSRLFTQTFYHKKYILLHFKL